MNNAHYLHPIIIAIFMALFTILSLIGFVIFLKRRQGFRSALLLLSVAIFGFCTYMVASF